MKKLIAFDQDDTINITKMPIDKEMADLLAQLLDKLKVCIISGCDWKVMKLNDIDTLKQLNREINWHNYLIMPTTGTQFWHYQGKTVEKLDDGKVVIDGWKREYNYTFTATQAKLIANILKNASQELGYWNENPLGEIIENRGSQITFSALGQWADPKDKRIWDPTMVKRKKIINLIEKDLLELNVSVRIGGSTSIDVTLPGIDKAYGMSRLMERVNIVKEDILFIGDKLSPGGNDYPIKLMGIESIEVTNAEETKWLIKGILGAI